MKLFDAHFHIIDPRFPLVPNEGYLPPAFDWKAYQAQAKALGITGGAIVSGSFQALDQTYLIDALEKLGPTFVGVTQLPAEAGDDEIRRLDEAGVRAVRFNVRRGGSAPLHDLETIARRVFDLVGWHIELYIDSKDLAPLAKRLLSLPRVVVDHLGLSKDGFPTLLDLVAKGVKVKATGFGRLAFDVPQALRELSRANPKALLFGTDLPGTRAPRAFEPSDITLVERALGPEASAALHDNAVELYRPRKIARSEAK